MSMLTRRPGPSLFGSLSPMSDVDRFPEFVRRLFNETPSPRSTSPAHPGWVPAVDVAETETELVLTAELPGMTEKDISITFENDVLTLRGEKSEETRENAKGWYLMERSFGAIQRTFALPRAVDPNAITARFSNGVLTITLPKTQQARGRTIEISPAS
jgi:HSP20 family protein